MDEFIEIVTWAQLRIHSKPCVLVNVAGFYDGLLGFFDSAALEGFIRAENRGLVQVAETAAEALAMVEREWMRKAEVPEHDVKLDELVK
jgi:hypothetical protein